MSKDKNQRYQKRSFHQPPTPTGVRPLSTTTYCPLTTIASLSRYGPRKRPVIWLGPPRCRECSEFGASKLSSAMKTSILLMGFLGNLLLSCPAWTWFAEGHEIVAIIAAD